MAAIQGISTDGTSAVSGENTATIPPTPVTPPIWPAAGVSGTSTKNGVGVIGFSDSGIGLWGHSNSNTGTGGVSETGIGMQGISNKGQAGVRGDCAAGIGVQGNSTSGRAVEGNCPQGTGVVGASTTGVGVYGASNSLTGVGGQSKSGHGVHGVSETEHGVVGSANGAGDGVLGQSNTGIGVHGTGGRLAGLFEGHVDVTGNINCNGDVILANADCAEDFDIADPHSIEPGTVMVLGEEGTLHQSQRAYDKRVAGVISGAGDYKPAIILDKQRWLSNRKPLALLGKVYCKVDAGDTPVEVGDLLTTSDRPGHAMKATDPLKAFGAVIGKALRPLRNGQGLVPILIALQ